MNADSMSLVARRHQYSYRMRCRQAAYSCDTLRLRECTQRVMTSPCQGGLDVAPRLSTHPIDKKVKFPGLCESRAILVPPLLSPVNHLTVPQCFRPGIACRPQGHVQSHCRQPGTSLRGSASQAGAGAASVPSRQRRGVVGRWDTSDCHVSTCCSCCQCSSAAPYVPVS